MTTATIERTATLWPVSHDEYHADGARSISHSELDVFIDSPERYYARYIARTIPPERTKALDLGIVFHDLILGKPKDMEPEEWFERQSQFVPIPDDVLNDDGHKKGKAWTTFAAEHKGSILLKDDEWASLVGMLQSAQEHPKAKMILFNSRGHNEITIKWDCRETGLSRRCRIDRLIPNHLIGDLKSARECEPRWFSRHAYDNGYARQVAYYQDGCEALYGERLPFVFVCVEKEPPYRCECFELDEEFIEQGRRENRRALHQLQDCRARNWWHAPTFGRIVKISAPSWAKDAENWNLN